MKYFRLKNTIFEGHFTHNPPIGKFSAHASDTDGNGKPKKQYCTKNSKPNKEIDAEQTQKLENEGKLKDDEKMTEYLKKIKLEDKL